MKPSLYRSGFLGIVEWETFCRMMLHREEPVAVLARIIHERRDAESAEFCNLRVYGLHRHLSSALRVARQGDVFTHYPFLSLRPLLCKRSISSRPAQIFRAASSPTPIAGPSGRRNGMGHPAVRNPSSHLRLQPKAAPSLCVQSSYTESSTAFHKSHDYAARSQR